MSASAPRSRGAWSRLGFAVALGVGLGGLVAQPESARAAGEFEYPISGPLTSTYYSHRSYGNHAALDIAGANLGSVGASRGGRVNFRGWGGGYGNLVTIDHGAGYETYYAHLASFAVSYGQQVAAGATVGYEGSTGNSSGPHVHFEIRRWGAKRYLPGVSGQYVAKGRPIGQTYSGLSPISSASSSAEVARFRAGWEVIASAVNVRSGPGTGYAVIGTLHRGERMIGIAQDGAWRKIAFRGRVGWFHGGYAGRRRGIDALEVTAAALNVRSGPSTGHGIVGTLRRHELYAVRERSGSWARITWGDGTTRWCHTGYTRRLAAE